MRRGIRHLSAIPSSLLFIQWLLGSHYDSSLGLKLLLASASSLDSETKHIHDLVLGVHCTQT